MNYQYDGTVSDKFILLYQSYLTQSENNLQVTESTLQSKIKYPKAVIFILGNEFCERFCYYGLRAVLSLYLKNVLLYHENKAVAINHLFILLCYFFPIIGATIADSLIGKYKTILYLTFMYCIGAIVLSVGAIDFIDLPRRDLTWIGLVLIAIGTGGIKPCVSSFGADQFRLPEQTKQLAQFFSIFYFAVNIGSFLSAAITPRLRTVRCFGSDSCYPLSFGLPSILMALSLVFFITGKPLYVIRKPEGNILTQVVGRTIHALKTRNKLKNTIRKEHWLDYASDKYDEKIITSVKGLFDVAVVFIPAPFFWAVFDQQSSTWIFQADRMNASVGKWNILPEQLQTVNPIFILIVVPVFECIIYPSLAKCHLLTTPLQKFGLGIILSSIAFGMSAVLQHKIMLSEEKSVHILWQLPQIIVMSMAEILFCIQGLDLCFTQAPVELKSVACSLWLLAAAVGNLFVSVVAQINIFHNKVHELLFYCAVILLDFVFFLSLALKFKYRQFHS